MTDPSEEDSAATELARPTFDLETETASPPGTAAAPAPEPTDEDDEPATTLDASPVSPPPSPMVAPTPTQPEFEPADAAPHEADRALTDLSGPPTRSRRSAAS